jgi:hypothetical protein
MAHDLVADPPEAKVESPQHLATWYAQGYSDGLGDRLLMFDNTSAPSWEILRFRPTLAFLSRFEAALRERVERLASFHHPTFPVVRPVQELGHEDGLAVVSTYVSGVRLSDALTKPRSAAFAVRLIRQLMPALIDLQRHGPDIAHGALDVDRIVVTAQGRLMIREHMLGSALESLGYPATRLWADFGILASPARTTTPRLDERCDVMQLGLMALSLMAGRRIGPEEYPEKIDQLLDEMADRSTRQALTVFQPLRYWLERALQLDHRVFDSARDANEALMELRDEPQQGDEQIGLLASGSLPHSLDGATADIKGPREAARRSIHLIAPERVDAGEAPAPAPVVAPASAVAPAPAPAAAPSSTPVPVMITAAPAKTNGLAAVRNWTPPRQPFGAAMRWTTVAVTVLAVGEGVVIARLLSGRATPPPVADAAVMIDSMQPGSRVLVDDEPAGVTPLQLNVGPRVRSIRIVPVAVTGDLDAVAPPIAEPKPPAPAEIRAQSAGDPVASQRTGGFRLSSPVELHVLDGERVLGSSEDAPIVVAAGRHEFEFVNSAIGFRSRRVVTVRPGQITSVSITPPNGIVNINAVPWAAVWIDGNAVGETPVGNLSVAPGEHEIVFRHPQLGERRERTIVRTDVPTRVTANLQNPN